MRLLLFYLMLCTTLPAYCQQVVPILSFEVSTLGTPIIAVENDPSQYYVLYADHQARTLVQSEDIRAVLTEPIAALDQENYQVRSFPRNAPGDLDQDGIDDLTELAGFPEQSPLNPVSPIPYADGVACIHTRETYTDLAFQPGEADENPRLADLEFVKFYVLDNDEADSVRVYFMNTVNHEAHVEFARAVGIPTQSNGNSFFEDMRGLLIYHPDVTAPSGEAGVYTFEFQQFDDYPYEIIAKVYELLAANLPFLQNNLSYLPLHQRAVARYNVERDQYDTSRIPVLLEGDLYEGIDYLPLNLTEGYGRLRLMSPGERPDGRDIVVYETIPNDLPRVGGIITTVVQTPLSHVNLRALQNNVPNAFIRDALDDPLVAGLLDQFVYYRVKADTFELRPATPVEVDAFYDNLRPDTPQTPIRDLTVTNITPLDDIAFAGHGAFGAKTGNVAVMRDFGFPQGTIPNGFGIPFYFYDEFMKFNDFYPRIQDMLEDPDFQADFSVQDEQLGDLRDDMEDAPLPSWMFDALTVLQQSFPEGTNIRCRSSTNNEDLPGFSGAGLYDSKTHKTTEGHIEKTIKEVFAGMWHFRAYAEREFYRVDHFEAAMGVLVHPNFKEEKANGVGVTSDPIYGTNGTYYLNTQVGEDLVTNPDGFSIPEEILLNDTGSGPTAYEILRRSNLIPQNQQVLNVDYLDELRGYMQVIHAEFGLLYDAVNDPTFSMDIEYKIDSTGQLVIKQARPWIGFLEGGAATTEEDIERLKIKVWPNPASEQVNLSFYSLVPATLEVTVMDMLGRSLKQLDLGTIPVGFHQSGIPISGLPPGSYLLQTWLDYYGKVYVGVKTVVVR